MSVINANVLGAGVRAPVSEFSAAVTELFPNPNRSRIIESSIAGRKAFDTLPVNQSLTGSLTDNYLEFRIPGIEGRFVDLSSILLELDLTITQSDGTTTFTEGDDHLTLLNGLGCGGLFKSVTCFLNEQPVESNPVFTQWSFIKQSITFRPGQVSSLAENCFYNREQ